MAVRIRRLLIVGVALYLAVCAAMFVLQRRLQYVPDASPLPAPAAVGLPGAVAEGLTTQDGERLVTWWVAPSDASQPVFLYLPGNGANLVNRARRFERLTAQGAGLLAVSWRGYGGSSGSPSEAGLMADAGAAYARLAQRVAPQRIVIYGESLGTTVSVMLAAQVPAAALVLDSSFGSALAVAGSAYPWLPVRWLLRDPLRADLAAPRVNVPVLQVHCRDDPVIALQFSLRLNELLPQRRPLHIVEARCHVPSLLQYETALFDFIGGVMAAQR